MPQTAVGGRWSAARTPSASYVAVTTSPSGFVIVDIRSAASYVHRVVHAPASRHRAPGTRGGAPSALCPGLGCNRSFGAQCQHPAADRTFGAHVQPRPARLRRLFVQHKRRRRGPPQRIGPQPRRGGHILARGAAPMARQPRATPVHQPPSLLPSRRPLHRPDMHPADRTTMQLSSCERKVRRRATEESAEIAEGAGVSRRGAELRRRGFQKSGNYSGHPFFQRETRYSFPLRGKE